MIEDRTLREPDRKDQRVKEAAGTDAGVGCFTQPLRSGSWSRREATAARSICASERDDAVVETITGFVATATDGGFSGLVVAGAAKMLCAIAQSTTTAARPWGLVFIQGLPGTSKESIRAFQRSKSCSFESI